MKAGKRGQTVVMNSWCWGAADTLQDAKRNFQAQRGRLTDGYLILVFDADTEFLGIDEVGRHHYRGNAPERHLVEPRKRPGSGGTRQSARSGLTAAAVELANQAHPSGMQTTAAAKPEARRHPATNGQPESSTQRHGRR